MKLQRLTTNLGELTVKDGELRMGNLQMIRAQVVLEEGIDYTSIQGKLLLSPEGADKCNQIAGLSIFEPHDDRSWEDQRDAGGFVEVRRRCVVAGRTPTGQMQVVSSSIVFSPRSYFLHALTKKVRYNTSAGCLGGPEDRPEKRGEKDTSRWQYFPIDEAIGIWADLTHKDVFGMVEAYTQDRKFADRRAAGIVRRNALCLHSALGGQKIIGQVPKGQEPPTWAVNVFSWKGEDIAGTEQEAAAVAAAVGAGKVDHPALEGARMTTADVTEQDLDPEAIPVPIEDKTDDSDEAAELPSDLPPIPGEED